MATELRQYEPSECGPKGYPVPWERGDPRIPDLVRELAGHRCVRCQHPFICGETPGHWSPCDERCSHLGPLRIWGGNKDGWLPIATEDLELQRHNAGTVAAGGRPVEAEWRVLTVHHLTGDKLDCRWWNLAALCQRDHLEIQGRVRMEQVYTGEHSPWFRPYAAGYYAWTYLGEDLSREETDARLDELLSLELAR
jgi:hypothetical protein